jgi:hypothetical protein
MIGWKLTWDLLSISRALGTFEIFLVYEMIDSLLDMWNLGHKHGRDERNCLLDKSLMGQGLKKKEKNQYAIGRANLRGRITFRIFMILKEEKTKILQHSQHRPLDKITYRTIVAWYTNFRSSSTVFITSLDSCCFSARIAWLMLIRIYQARAVSFQSSTSGWLLDKPSSI